jgi:hypothetical protein
MFAEI